MKNIVEITVKLADGTDLTFQPKYNPIIKIMRGVRKEPNGFMSQRSLNDKEALIIVCAPPEVQNFFNDKGDIHYWIEEELNKR